MNEYVARRSSTPPPPYINLNSSNNDTVMPLLVNNLTNETQSYSSEQSQGQDVPPSYQTIQNPLNNHIDPVNVIILPTIPTQTLNRNYNQAPPSSYLNWSIVSIVGSFCTGTSCICL